MLFLFTAYHNVDVYIEKNMRKEENVREERKLLYEKNATEMFNRIYSLETSANHIKTSLSLMYTLDGTLNGPFNVLKVNVVEAMKILTSEKEKKIIDGMVSLLFHLIQFIIIKSNCK